MPEQIEFDKRSIWRNVFDPAAWQNLLSGVGDVAGDVASTWEQLEKIKGTKVLGTSDKPYDPKITYRDYFAFTPNVTLILIGCGLLGLALILKMRK